MTPGDGGDDPKRDGDPDRDAALLFSDRHRREAGDGGREVLSDGRDVAHRPRSRLPIP